MEYKHELEFKVRDYECDMQGVVNNGVYQNYLEHARHEFLRSRGIDFARLTEEGVNLVVIRAELDYRKSLTSNDSFVVRSRVRDGPVRGGFLHQRANRIVVLDDVGADPLHHLD